jgi:predicted Zn-dependent peptidase
MNKNKVTVFFAVVFSIGLVGAALAASPLEPSDVSPVVSSDAGTVASPGPDSAVAATRQGDGLLQRVREHRLENGMTVLALRKPGAPVVSLMMNYLVGSVDEPSGSTGMAHLLEHMLFKGTTRLGTRDWAAEKPLLEKIERAGAALDDERRKSARPGYVPDPEKLARLEGELKELQAAHRPLVIEAEFDAIYQRNGAVGLNASTSADLTNYFVSLPSNRLELWASLESERMRDPVLRQFYTERDVVMEERRQRRETQPSGVLYEALLSTAFKAHPYRNPVIGWESDLKTLSLDATREFYRQHYGPGSAVVVAVGDLDPDDFFALVERYFGELPTREKEKSYPTVEPTPSGARRVIAHFDAQPRAALAYLKPTLPHRDDYVLDVIDALLTDGRSSRLNRELVDRAKVAVSVGSGNGLPGARFDNLFAIFVTPASGVEPDEALEAVRAELTRLAKEPPAPEELEKILTRLSADSVRSLVSHHGIARRLAYFQSLAGDWRYAVNHPKILATITPEEVSAVAARYFTPENETVAILRKPPPEPLPADPLPDPLPEPAPEPAPEGEVAK